MARAPPLAGNPDDDAPTFCRQEAQYFQGFPAPTLVSDAALTLRVHELAATRDFKGLARELSRNADVCSMHHRGLSAVRALSRCREQLVDAGMIEVALTTLGRHVDCTSSLYFASQALSYLIGGHLERAVRCNAPRLLCSRFRELASSDRDADAAADHARHWCASALTQLFHDSPSAQGVRMLARETGVVRSCLELMPRKAAELETALAETGNPKEELMKLMHDAGRLLRVLQRSAQIDAPTALNDGSAWKLQDIIACMQRNHLSGALQRWALCFGLVPVAEAEVKTHLLPGEQMCVCAPCVGKGAGAPLTLAALAAMPGAFEAVAAALHDHPAARGPAARLLALLIQQNVAARLKLRALATWPALSSALITAHIAADASRGIGKRYRMRCTSATATAKLDFDGVEMELDQAAVYFTEATDAGYDGFQAEQLHDVSGRSLPLLDAAVLALVGGTDVTSALEKLRLVAADAVAAALMAEEEAAAAKAGKVLKPKKVKATKAEKAALFAAASSDAAATAADAVHRMSIEEPVSAPAPVTAAVPLPQDEAQADGQSKSRRTSRLHAASSSGADVAPCREACCAPAAGIFRLPNKRPLPKPRVPTPVAK